MGIPFVLDSNNEKKFLILKNNEIISIYIENRNQILFSGIISNLFVKEGLVSPWDLISSSFLKEDKIEYHPINMGRKILELPWVEGVDGQGIKEKIFFSMGPFSGIYLYNGFISFKKPELYLMNSRIKNLIVRDLMSGLEKNILLEDTPNPQLINIPDSKNHKIELEILDVYPGTKFTDTCIAGIYLKGF